jgi:Cd2+/Zn2+-exporting ATPase
MLWVTDMSELATYKFEITGIDCANCAAKLESEISRLEGISNVSLNFMKSSLTYDCDHSRGKEMEARVREVAAEEEPDAVITAKGHEHDHEHHHEEECECHAHHHHDHEHEECECGEHHHEHGEETAVYHFEITGIDCANCAAKLESEISKLEGISNVSLNFMKNSLTYECDHSKGKEMEARVRAVAAKEEPDAVITAKGHEHHHHEHHHDHHAEERLETEIHEPSGARRLRIEDVDCADCAAELEQKISRLEGLSNVSFSYMNSTLTFDCADPSNAEQMIRELVAKEEPDAKVIAYEAKTRAAEPEEKDIMPIRLAAGALLFVLGLFLKGMPQILAEIAAYLILGYDVLYKAVRGIGRGQVFDEHFLMSVATLAAMYLKDFREAAGVMLFYQIGEYFQDRAVDNSRRSIGELMDIRPDYANVKRGDTFVQVSPADVAVGDVIRVKPGERIPLDGVVLHGASSLNTASLTGESKLRDVDEGDEVISGSVNENGVLEIKVTKPYGESTVARILDLVENQDSRKANAEHFITKFSRIYTPAVVFSAIAVAIIVAIVTKDVNAGIYRACTFLVISCPCALVISVPLSFFAGIGGLSKQGILVKGANMVEPLARAKTAVLDKTGTLTEGVFEVSEVRTSLDRETVLKDAAYAEASSNHPIAAGIRAACGEEINTADIDNVNEIAGRGVQVTVKNDMILAGNSRMMHDFEIEFQEEDDPGTMVYVAKNGVYEGCIILEDRLKADAKDAVARLKQSGLKTVIVSGDNPKIAAKAGQALGVDEVHGGCMPQDKVERINEYRKEGITVFAGDGVNDAPVLAAADIGFAMGALGSDAAIEAADVVIMDDKPTGMARAISGAKKILRVVNQNIYGAIGIKILTLILSAFGIANMWWAIFADTGVAMLCVMNAMRLLRLGDAE